MTTPDEEQRVQDAGWRRHMRGAVAERIGLKVTALVIALLLWFVVHVVHVASVAP